MRVRVLKITGRVPWERLRTFWISFYSGWGRSRGWERLLGY